MKYESDKIGQNKKGWWFKIKYIDRDGFNVIIDNIGEEFITSHQAKIWRTKKRKEVVKSGGLLNG